MTIQRRLTDIGHYLSNAVLRVLGKALRLLPYSRRLRVGSWIGRAVLMRVPAARKRVHRNLDMVMPQLTKADRDRLITGIGDNFGRVLVEEMMMADVVSDPTRFRASGDGLEALVTAQEQGRGAIIASAHYGNWEGARASALAQGVEIAGVYRTHNNPYYNADFVAALRTLSPNAFSKGRQGTRDLIKHLRGGGVAEILVDQKQTGAPLIDFLGHPAETTLTAAKLALSMNIPLIPVITFRAADGETFDSVFAAPIPPSDEHTMMAAVNDQLSVWIRERPEQWFWFHRRWR
ncbi:KDO2-lipid IV(A) lauroyltransferase [Monaibacterium marinum]|uniref:KDO2-lipid IV(A) lauroyltransferase n=1 Tax=Pontivivens marinum TaxID=1690039 RepID=A0A2C9CY79_9RHOB|nr:lauroyl acyltransferase [Monaibacterium marinum]SOH95409.1 KDO2-lipid IV(A) lauroyltransferase [Monaibacterium marinum]